MAVPVFTSLAPLQMLTAGGAMVTIQGQGFRVPAVPAPSGAPALEKMPTVGVSFGSTPAPDVAVISDQLLVALCPAHDAGVVDVVIENLDDGAPIPGESVTAAAAFTFVLPKHTREYESDLARLVRTLLRKLKQQVIPDVVRPVNTDATSAPDMEISLAKIGKFPSLVVLGPKLRENRFYSVNGQQDVATASTDPTLAGSWVATKQPYTVDLNFQIIGVSNNDVEALNLMNNLVTFVRANLKLRFDRLANDPSAGQVEFEFDFAPDGAPQSTGSANDSNIHQFSAEVVVRGFDLEDFSGLVATTTPDDPTAPFFEPGAAAPATATTGRVFPAEDVHVDPAEQIGDS